MLVNTSPVAIGERRTDNRKKLGSKELGINLGSRSESQLFRWFLACLLFGKPIQHSIARTAYIALVGEGITSVSRLTEAKWNELVTLLDQAHYVHYDYSTATKLLLVAKGLKEQYGNVSGLIRQSENVNDLEARLMSFKGIGPVTAAVFLREVAPIWFPEAVMPNDYQSAVRAAKILNSHGYDAYMIGGAVRDLWLERRPKDFDLVTNANPEQIMSIEEFSKSKYKDTAQAFGVTRVRFSHDGLMDNELEIATFRKDVGAHQGRKYTKVKFALLEDDVGRRDLTINALALDPLTNFIIDYVGGIDDLYDHSIRFIGDPLQRIKEDPLRIMRAIRFKNELEFSYHPKTADAIKRSVGLGYIERISTDRLRDELTKLLIYPSRHQAFLDLNEFGILTRILPEVTAGKGVMQPPQFHAEGDVWRHELLILDYLPDHPSKRLVWAALLHDIGKVPTRIKPTTRKGRIRFDRHYAVGAAMSKAILLRLKFSNHDIRDITWMIYNHMSIDDLPSMRTSHQNRMLGHPAFGDLLELHKADAAASWRPGHLVGSKPRFMRIEQLWHQYQSACEEVKRPSLKYDLGIDGYWLLKHFGSEFDDSNRKLMGKILDELNDWYQDERIRDPQAYTQKTRELLVALHG